MLGPGQEKDDLRINTDPPVDMNLGCREVGRLLRGTQGRRGQSRGGQGPEVVSRERDSQWRAPGLL